MIEINISVDINGLVVAVKKEEPSVPGFRDKEEALKLFDEQVALIRRVLLAHTAPVIEHRGTIIRGAGEHVIANPDPYY